MASIGDASLVLVGVCEEVVVWGEGDLGRNPTQTNSMSIVIMWYSWGRCSLCMHITWLCLAPTMRTPALDSTKSCLCSSVCASELSPSNSVAANRWGG